jgi:very-short-patch-repair endonuclease
MTTCLDCKRELNTVELRAAMDHFGVALCEHHQQLIRRIIRRHNTTIEAIQLYYGLKNKGIYPMLEWWDGSKSVDIAISRVKLNLEIDSEYQMLTTEQVLDTLVKRMYDYEDGFTTIRIPKVLIRQCLEDIIEAVQRIADNMKSRARAV